MAYLEIQSPTASHRIAFNGDRLTIGRHSKNKLALADDLVSRYHCEIQRTGGGYLLRDLGSRNGTRVGNEMITEVTLSPGDEFIVGTTRIRLADDAAPRHTPEAPPAAIPLESAESPELNIPIAQAVPIEDGDDYPEGAIELEGEDPFTPIDEEDVPLLASRSDFATGSLESLAKVGRDVPFDVAQIALINARGSLVHAAATSDDQTAQTIRVLRLLLMACVRSAASDIHLEPKNDGGLVRLRVNGSMVEALQLPAEVVRRLMSLVKVLADIDISRKAMVQDGHFSAQLPDRRVDYRVSFTPAMYGQKLVVRVLDPQNAPQQLRDLNMPDWMFRSIRGVSRQDAGMLLVTGPTGSGKTTTLYAVLRQIDARQRNVLTIEDPIEYELPGATQIPVDDEQGNSFHSLLRSCLRQDPDVIVLGEIRDKETATTAMQAATTGHLVMSTVHAKDTIGTIFRLLDLGVEPYLVASTLNLVLAQRLARQLCPHCKVAKRPTPSQAMRLGRMVEGVSEIYTPGRCARCFGTGYTGRQAIFELLTTTDEIRDVILNTPNIAAIKKAIEMTMFTSLRESGMQLVTKGLTSMDEIDRVIGME